MAQDPFDGTVLPLHYQLHFFPEPDAFQGKETITLQITKPTKSITINAQGLVLREVKLSAGKSQTKALSPLSEEYHKKEQTVCISFSQEIAPGEVQLAFEFAAKYGKVDGLYRSTYLQGKSKKKMLTTQFEAPYARKAFPCIDHPAAKATFSVAITIDQHLQAVSNTMTAEEKPEEEGKKTVVFKTTPKMSTYLLYLGVGEFEIIEMQHQKTLLRLLTTPGKAQKGKFSLELAKKILSFFEEYFGIPYPLEKLDLIAVPDFAAGAMENWGAVTFREDALLYDPQTSSLANKQRVAEVVAHELAHQWFGNLVTMNWWDDLWLNESFATFMAYKAVDHLLPQVEIWETFFNHEMDRAFDLDALSSSHPVHVSVHNSHEIEEIFDEMSYSKGGSLLRMLELFVGEENFQRGLQSYLSAHRYGNAQAKDLWEHLSQASAKPISEVMDQWLHQTGYPVVEVQADEEKKSLSLKQKRFGYANHQEKVLWPIPLTVLSKENPISQKIILFEKEQQDLPLEKNNSPSWVKVNALQQGFYRVHYDSEMLKKLEQAVTRKELSERDRWGLHNDQAALCLAGEVSLEQYLSFALAFSEEDSSLVLIDLISTLNSFALLAKNEPYEEKIKATQRKLYGKLFSLFGWEARKGEKATLMQVRSMLLSSLGKLGDEEIHAKAKVLFQNPAAIHPDLKQSIYLLAAHSGEETIFQQLQELYRGTDDPQEKTKPLVALGGFQTEVLLRKALEYTMSEEVRQQNRIQVFMMLLHNASGRDLLWPWMKENWDSIKEMYGDGGFKGHWNRLIKEFSNLANLQKGEEIRNFLEADLIPGTERAIANMLEKMAINERFLHLAREQQKK